MISKRSPARLGATVTTMRLSEYPIGSPQSRAAARALLNARRADLGEGTRFVVSAVDRPVDPNQKCTCREPEAGTFTLCRCFL